MATQQKGLSVKSAWRVGILYQNYEKLKKIPIFQYEFSKSKV